MLFDLVRSPIIYRNIPNLVSKHLLLEGPEPLYNVCVCVTPAVSGVHGADEQQKLRVRSMDSKTAGYPRFRLFTPNVLHTFSIRIL